MKAITRARLWRKGRVKGVEKEGAQKRKRGEIHRGGIYRIPPSDDKT